MLKRRFDYFLLSTFTICFPLICACQKATQAPAIWQPSVESERTALKQPKDGEAIADVGLWLTKIYGLTERTAFLLGSYQFSSSTYRSLFLRTMDGGQIWKEVHQGISSATLFGIDFVNSQVGHAYGQLTTGDPEPPFILRSDDGGLSWRQVGQIEAEGSPAIYAFGFTDAQHGSIKLLFHAVGSTSKTPHRIEVHETTDGGKTWDRTESKMISDDEAGKIGDTMEEDTRHLRNGLGWQLEEAGGDAWTYGYWISRSVDNGTHWRRVSRFARHPFSPKPGELDVK